MGNSLKEIQVQCAARPGVESFIWPVPIYGIAPSGRAIQVGVSEAVQATGTLTSDNTVPADGATVTIGSQVYTFKTTLTASTTANQVLIVALDADATLLNLIRAINGTGTSGTDYGSLTPINGSVSAASAVTSHAFAVTALLPGTFGNLIATTETSSHLSWGGLVLGSGTDAALNVNATISSSGTLNTNTTITSVSSSVSITSKPVQYSGTTSNSSIATSTATVFTIAAGEYGFIQNLDDAALAVKLGTSASTTSLSFILPACTVALDGTGGSTTITDIGAVSVAPMSGTASYIAWKRAT